MPKFQKVPLGDLLIQNGLITQADLDKALRIQKDQPDLRVGDILIKIGVLTHEDLINFLGKQLGISCIDLSSFAPDSETLLSISKNLVEQHKIVPLKKEGKKLVVAMVDPLDIIALDNVSQITGFELQPMVATESDIKKFISRYYGELPEDIFIESKKVKETSPLLEEETITPDTPIIPLVDSLISKAYSLNASDFHIEPRENDVRIRYRIDGVTWDFMPLPKEIQNAVVSRIKVLADLDITETRLPQEGRFQVKFGGKQIDVRVSTIPTIYGEKIALRIFNLETSLFRIKELGMTEEDLNIFQEIIHKPYGLFVIAGPTGNGKSTTFYAVLQELNTSQRSIITLEDPVEYPLKNINQVSVNPKINLTYASALQSILRQIPDIVMIGEIRDKETAKFAVETALAGGLMLTTVHAYDAAGALTRLINIGLEPYLLCSSLVAVLAQRLVRILCPECKQSYKPSFEQLQHLGLNPDTEINLYKPKGCKVCYYTGYKRRTGIFEILKITPEIQNLILQKSSAPQILELAKSLGFTTMRENGIKKVLEGITSEEELYRVIYI